MIYARKKEIRYLQYEYENLLRDYKTIKDTIKYHTSNDYYRFKVNLEYFYRFKELQKILCSVFYEVDYRKFVFDLSDKINNVLEGLDEEIHILEEMI